MRTIAFLLFCLFTATHLCGKEVAFHRYKKSAVEIDFQMAEPSYRVLVGDDEADFIPLKKVLRSGQVTSVRDVAVAFLEDGGVHVFAIDRKGDLYYALRHGNDSWEGWENISVKKGLIGTPLREVSLSPDFKLDDSSIERVKSPGDIALRLRSEDFAAEIDGEVLKGVAWNFRSPRAIHENVRLALREHAETLAARNWPAFTTDRRWDDQGREFFYLRNLSWKPIDVRYAILHFVGGTVEHRSSDQVAIPAKSERAVTQNPFENERSGRVIVDVELINNVSKDAGNGKVREPNGSAPTKPIPQDPARPKVAYFTRVDGFKRTLCYVKNNEARTVYVRVNTVYHDGRMNSQTYEISPLGEVFLGGASDVQNREVRYVIETAVFK